MGYSGFFKFYAKRRLVISIVYVCVFVYEWVCGGFIFAWFDLVFVYLQVVLLSLGLSSMKTFAHTNRINLQVMDQVIP